MCIENGEQQGKRGSKPPGLSSLIVYPKRVVKNRSLMSVIFKGRRRSGYAEASKVVDKGVLSKKDEELFKSMLSREMSEDKYEVRRKLASGGMGIIYFVYDKDLKRDSIVKVLLPEHKENSAIVRNFVREARVTGRLEHPNIIPVHDLGYLPNYGIYFTMKYINGESLLDVITNLQQEKSGYVKAYNEFTLLNIFRKVCDAVSFAHSKRIIHRDIKPGNIMVGKYGEVLLMDWGLAKKPGKKALISPSFRKISARSVDDTRYGKSTQFGVVKGTPAYMSPEQAIGDNRYVGVYSDIFLLGATLYHMFTLATPYKGDDIVEIIGKARDCDYIPPEEFCGRKQLLSKELCRIIRRAMAPDKRDRYLSVEEMAADIDNLIHGKMEFVTHHFERGEFLMREGEYGAESYIILNGQVKVFRKSGDGELTLGIAEEGDIVGEMALIADLPRIASIIAIENTEVLVLNKEMFTLNLRKLPFWMEKTISTLAERLRNANVKLTSEQYRT